jgi:hypothetical protein
MKSRKALALTDFLAATTAFAAGLYSFVHSSIYNAAITRINQSLPGFEAAIPTMVTGTVLALCVFGRERAYMKTHNFSLILALPSILAFSNFDWFKTLGTPITLDFVKTDLPFTQIFAVALILMGSRTTCFFSSQTRNLRHELLIREASEEEIEKATMKQYTFTLTLLGFCLGGVFLTGILVPALGMSFSNLLLKLPYPHVTLGLIVTATLATCLIIYLKSRAGDVVKPTEQRAR